MDSKPEGLAKRASVRLPSTCWSGSLASFAETVPSAPMVMLEAFAGMVIAGCRSEPLEVTNCPVADSLKLPSRV